MPDPLDSIERISLTSTPTPLQELPRLAKAIGLRRLLIKRDDLTDLAMGGNKARKLEYEFPEILRAGCDTVVTIGGRQSNHARMTAGAARRCGLDVRLVLGGDPLSACEGNMLLEVMLGAEIRYLNGNDDNDALAAAMEVWVQELRAGGKRPYPLPIGGSTGRGALGYVRAMRELTGQLDAGPAQLILPVGSCGTLAGCLLGARVYLPGTRIIGISVSRTAPAIAQRTAELIEECRQLLGTAVTVARSDIECYDTYVQSYGALTPEAKDAILLCGRTEGILLDPVYTGKAMAGLIDLVRRKRIDASQPVVFLHTGGLPGLFAYGHEFAAEAKITNI